MPIIVGGEITDRLSRIAEIPLSAKRPQQSLGQP
jgi:hypothetical protein